MEKILKSGSEADAPVKQKYVKPTMQTHELEVEEAILDGFGSDTRGGGSWGEEISYAAPTPKSTSIFWEEV